MKPKAKGLCKARQPTQSAEPLLAMPEWPGQVKGTELARAAEPSYSQTVQDQLALSKLVADKAASISLRGYPSSYALRDLGSALHAISTFEA